MEGTFSFAGLDENDVEAYELRWNEWVDGLYRQGLRPDEDPVSWTNTSATFVLLPLLILAAVS